MFGLLQTPMVNFWYLYLTHGSTIVKICSAPGDNYMWWYPIFKPNDDLYMKPSSFSSISWIFWIGKGFLQILWFSFLNSNNNLYVSFLRDNIGGSPLWCVFFLKHPYFAKPPYLLFEDNVLCHRYWVWISMV